MDAKDANMSIKQLNRLHLSWDRNEEWESKEKVEEEILEVLQPDTEQLRSLELRGYKGVHFPQWMSSPSLKHLTFLWLEDCESLQLPALGKLPCLKSLVIRRMPNVKYVHEEVYDGGEVFVALESLSLSNLPNLIRLSRDDGENMFPRLSDLSIWEKCKEDLLSSIHKLSSLQTLSVWDNEELTRFPDGMLQNMTALKKLSFWNLSNIESLPDCFGDLPSLRELTIRGCPKLRCLPTSLSLSSLEGLEILGCPPELKKRCEKEWGEDWPKIAHIPRIYLDYCSLKKESEGTSSGKNEVSNIVTIPGETIITDIQNMDSLLSKARGSLKNETEGTSSQTDEVSCELSRLMRIRDFISLLLTYRMKINEEGLLKSWLSSFPQWKDHDTVIEIDEPGRVLTEKALSCMKGFIPMEIINHIERGEASIFNHDDQTPEAILHLSIDLAVDQLIQTLLSRDSSAFYVRLFTRNVVEKKSVVNKIKAALDEKHNMFGIDKDFLRALWINASTYETDAEIRVQEEINLKMGRFFVTEDDDMLHMQCIEKKIVVTVVDADSKKLDLQKVHFPTGIVVLITTELSTQEEKDDDFRITSMMDLNIRTQDHLLPWEVFCSHLDRSMILVRSSMAIQRIAVEIVKECHGHLLATVIVAKFLENLEHVKHWELALDKLSSLNPSYNYQDTDQIGISRVMVNAFLNITWESIDDTQKLCLELSLFVDNIKIGVRDDILVSDWEKIILGYIQELGEYRRQLQYYIEDLQDRFVLFKDERGNVYLPIETYDIIKSLHTSKPSILRHGALGLTEPPDIERWHSLIQIELMDSQICELPQSPNCPKLKVLLLQGNADLMDISDSFFNHMPLLQHLDLSYTSIRDLPPSVSKLMQLKKFYLRGCDLFMELPPQIGQLKNLKELDLDGTLITHLSKEIGELINLQSLTLCFDAYHHGKKGKQISKSTIIPPGLISNLTQLKYLSINVDPEDEQWNEDVNRVLVEIFGLERLETVSIYVPEAELLELIPAQISLSFRLVVGHHLQRFISRVTPMVEQEFKRCGYSLKFVNGVGVPIGVKMNLEHFKALYLDRHMTIKSLSDFELRNLCGLEVCILAECNKMETIVDGGNLHDGPVLSNLEFLSAFYMKNLRSICEGPNPSFLHLKSIALHTCPMLTTVFTIDSLQNLSSLEVIIIEDCPKLTTLISHDDSPKQKTQFVLPRLRRISLLYLPKLVNIFNGLHVGNVLEEMIFYYCPKLQSFSKSELSSKSLKIIKGESMWREALKWNAAEWGDAGVPKFFEHIFSPINEEDTMNHLAALEETQLNEYHNTRYQRISSSTQSIAKSSLETPVSSPLAPISVLGSSKGEA